MNTVPHSPDHRPGSRDLLLAGGLAALVCFVAHFLAVRRFGLYEDDYIYTLGCFDWSLGHWWGEAVKAIVHPVQGRPLNHLVRRTLNFIFLRGDTLLYGHLLSWAMISANAALLYTLARRHLGWLAATAAALVYVLYPADASRQILMHQSDLLFGTTLCLGGLLAFASERPWLGWLFGIGCLLNYESFYLPLLVAPLLTERFSLRADRGKMLRHAAAFAGIALATLAARKWLGDDRAGELASGGAGGAVRRSIESLWLGPWISAKAGVLETLKACRGATTAAWLGGALVAAITGGTLWTAGYRPGANEPSDEARRGDRLRIGVAGLLAWAGAYALCIRPDNFPPAAVIGRLSGVHVAGSIGAALLAGALIETAGRKLCTRRAPVAIIVAMALGAGLATVRGIRIQTDEYVKHWAEQRVFWTRIVSLIPDLQDGEPVLLDLRGPKGVFPETPGFPRFGLVNYAPVTLHRLIDYPKTWKTVPRVYCLYDGCPADAQADGVLLRTPSWFWTGLWPVVRDGHFLYLHMKDGVLTRDAGPILLSGHRLFARAPDAAQRNVTPNPLMRSLFEAGGQLRGYRMR